MSNIFENLQLSADQKNVPWYCSVEVTQHCNFQCKHCYIPRSYSKKAKRIPFKVYKRFFSELKQIGGLAVCFTGGEPLLFAEDLFEMLDMIRDEKMIPVIYTNGSLVTREIARKIREKRVLDISVTLYGSRPETMDNFTKLPGSFEKAVQGIKWLIEENNHVNVRWPVTRENIEEFTAFYDLACELGARPSHYTFLDCALDGSEHAYELQMDENDFVRYLDIFSTLDVFSEYFPNIEKSDKVVRQKMLGQCDICSAGRGYIYLRSDGSIYPCTHITKSIGNILTTPIHEIWQDENPVLKEVRSATLDKMECANCEYIANCGLCIAEFYLKTGSFTKPSEHSCKMAKLAHRVRQNYLNNYKVKKQ